MSDITAVVLSVGEPYTERALASLVRQTLAPAETILVERVSPFHRALNTGAWGVGTPYFVQVDADMILNAWCLEELRQRMTPAVGMVVGPLWDPLMGVEIGVKLFRRQCFDVAHVRDTVSPDTDFNAALKGRGWEVVYALPSPRDGDAPTPWPTMGAHCPPYTPLYTYRRYHLLGARYGYRRDFPTFGWRYRTLGKSDHPTALIARIALAHGLFLRADRDLLTPGLYTSSPEFEALDRFLGSGPGAPGRAVETVPLLDADPSAVFEAFSRLAMTLRREQQSSSFRACMRDLDASAHPRTWVARVALAHGLFMEGSGEGRISSEYSKIQDFLATGFESRKRGPDR
ncbi:MAG: hypothetical protein DMD79_09970 [Candidatus Rokuibacteriota bacterium]|nr:MAG: hypothetical protein DMD79_09970 [Candidatus Rokubacteria bacterium]